jgi:hypothetical protein
MYRRQFVLGSTALSLAGLSSSAAFAQTTCVPTPLTTPTLPTSPISGIDAVAEIKALRIPTGPYAGGYEIAPNGRLNWYFAHLGLLPIVQFLSPADLEKYVRGSLDAYLRNLNAASTIDDVDFPQGRANTALFTRVLSDSDDSYAATFLSLTARYLRASRNWIWWDANKVRIKELAYRNLALTAKRTGLTSVFQAPRSQTNSIGYLMDNCEVYRGLRDYAALLRERGEVADANYYDLLAANAAGGMVSMLFNVAGGAFTPSDASLIPETTFYPGTTCQVFPQAFGVTELTPLFDKGWAYLNARSPSWEDGRYDPYSWAVLGFVAAKRGQTVQARAQMASIEKKFTSIRSAVTINELGFYQRTKTVLAGGVDV